MSCRGPACSWAHGCRWRRLIRWLRIFRRRRRSRRCCGGSAWAHAANLVLLDPGEPDGYLRQWQPPGFPPIRHIAYAVQWFSLAAALVVIYIVTNLRRAERKPA